MIIVRVELHSAKTGKVTELARMCMANSDTGTETHGNYHGSTYVGRDTAALNRRQVSRQGTVEGYARKQLHVWNLVNRMLTSMGYVK